jgi:dihydrofolate reductase
VPTRPVTYSLTVSLDGYVTDPDGSLDWGEPSDELFAFATDEVRALGAHLLGRRLYEAMLYWETADSDPDLPAPHAEFARIWQQLPKVVFSRTLSSVQGNARLATGSLAEEVAALRAAPEGGSIAIGGATLAAAAAELDLVDEYRMRVHPALLGGGSRYFPHAGRHVELELLECRPLSGGVVFLHHRVVRQRPSTDR